MQTNILIVDDETAIREMVALSLRHEGFGVVESEDVANADMAIARLRPDLILLDWMMPGVSGIEYARRLRREEPTADLPIIMLTAKGQELDMLNGFDAGVDDYIAKPFSVKELVARIRAVLKRTRGYSDDEMLVVDALMLDAVCLLYTSPSPRDATLSRMPSSA